jgi:hypothetical protein
MSSRSWVALSLARRPDILCWVLKGRTPRSLMLFVGQSARLASRSGTILANGAYVLTLSDP